MNKRIITFIVVLNLISPVITYAMSDEDAHKAILGISQNINKDLPLMIDSLVRLDSTIAMKRILIYRGTIINYAKSEIDVSQLRLLLTKNLINTFCTSPDTKYWRKNNFSWKHIYFDKDQIFVMQITSSNDNC